VFNYKERLLHERRSARGSARQREACARVRIRYHGASFRAPLRALYVTASVTEVRRSGRTIRYNSNKAAERLLIQRPIQSDRIALRGRYACAFYTDSQRAVHVVFTPECQRSCRNVVPPSFTPQRIVEPVEALRGGRS